MQVLRLKQHLHLFKRSLTKSDGMLLVTTALLFSWLMDTLTRTSQDNTCCVCDCR